MAFLQGKKILITGLLSNRSIAYGIAQACKREGAELAFTYVGERFKGRIPTPPTLPEIVGINLPKTQSTETTDDLTAPPALLTNSENLVSQSH